VPSRWRTPRAWAARVSSGLSRGCGVKSEGQVTVGSDDQVDGLGRITEVGTASGLTEEVLWLGIGTLPGRRPVRRVLVSVKTR